MARVRRHREPCRCTDPQARHSDQRRQLRQAVSPARPERTRRGKSRDSHRTRHPSQHPCQHSGQHSGQNSERGCAAGSGGRARRGAGPGISRGAGSGSASAGGGERRSRLSSARGVPERPAPDSCGPHRLPELDGPSAQRLPRCCPTRDCRTWPTRRGNRTGNRCPDRRAGHRCCTDSGSCCCAGCRSACARTGCRSARARCARISCAGFGFSHAGFGGGDDAEVVGCGVGSDGLSVGDVDDGYGVGVGSGD